MCIKDFIAPNTSVLISQVTLLLCKGVHVQMETLENRLTVSALSAQIANSQDVPTCSSIFQP